MQETEFFGLCRAILKEVRPSLPDIRPEDTNMTFTALGLDSLDVMNFFLELDSHLDATMAELDMEDYDTLAKVYGFLASQQ